MIDEQHLAYLLLDAGDRARLRALGDTLHAELPMIAARFYDAVWTSLGSASVSVVSEPVEQLRATLVEWLASALVGPYDDAFGAKRSLIVRRHTQIGLTQQHMFTALNAVRAAFVDRVGELYAPDEANLVRRSVDSLFDIEVALMLAQYERDVGARTLIREREIHSDRITALQTMTAGLAHEVRNPLNAAKLQLELLERRLLRHGNDPKLTEPIALAHLEIRRLTDLLDEFLCFARPPDLQRADHDVVAIVQHVIELERPIADRNGIRLELSSSPTTVVAAVDAAKLHEIVQHLVRNGVEAAARGGLVTIAISRDRDRDGALRIRIGDSGPGIPELIRPRIYEPFFSTKEAGTGMGMSIVHSYIAMHGGTIDVATGPGGTMFDVRIPR